MTHKANWPDATAPAEWVSPKVHKMRCIAHIAGRYAHFEADLVFISSVPYAVFQWDDYPDGKCIPAAVVQLDPTQLSPLPESWDPVRWMYSSPLEDPRRMQ